MIKEKASGAGRCRHHTACALPQGSAPDAFGAAKLLDEKAAGRSCRRCARPDLHIAAGAPAFKRLPRTGSHVQQRACSPRPASGRNTRPPEGQPALSGQRTRPDEPAQCSMPPSARRQVLLRRTWPFVSLTAMRTPAFAAPPSKPPTPGSPPWEGPQLPANTRHPRLEPAERAQAGNAA